MPLHAVANKEMEPEIERSLHLVTATPSEDALFEAEIAAIEQEAAQFVPEMVPSRLDLGEEDAQVTRYFQEISRFPLLTKAEEQALAQAIEDGKAARAELETTLRLRPKARAALEARVAAGETARLQFIQSNYRLAVSIARRYPVTPGIRFLDHIQQGNLGLFTAVEKFNWRKGFKFSTFAYHPITQAISRNAHENSQTIRVPDNVAAQIVSILRQESTPRTAETEDDVEAMPPHLREAYIRSSVTYLDSAASDDGLQVGQRIGSDLSDPEEEGLDLAAQDEMFKHIAGGLDHLWPRARAVVCLFYGLSGMQPMSGPEIAKHLGTTPATVATTLTRAMKKLRTLDVIQEARPLLD